MKTLVSVKQKKNFIRWALSSFQFKRRESVWILNYLMSHDDLVKNVIFVEQAQFCPRAAVISTTNSDDVPFRFYKDGEMSTDSEKSFHDVRLNRVEPLFIEIKLGRSDYVEYLEVLEDNNYVPKSLSLNDQYNDIAENLLNYSLYEFQRDKILDSILQAKRNGEDSKVNELYELLSSIIPKERKMFKTQNR